MRFRPFPKLGEHPPAHAPGGTYRALEKIHGAQLVLGLPAGGDRRGGLRVGKRKAWLGDDEPFFGWQLLRVELAEAAHEMRRQVGPESLGGRDLVAYCELFGGGYPHPDVPARRVHAPVQTGVWYSPGAHVAAFAILLAEPGAADGELLAPSETAGIAARSGLLSPPVVGTGTRAAMSALPVRRPTAVPAALGLPPVEGNIAEGHVLWPDRRSTLSSLAASKYKIPEMAESRFDESAPHDPGRVMAAPGLLGLVPSLVNPARIASAASKTGRHDRAALLEEVVLDVLADLESALPATIKALRPEELDALIRRIDAQALTVDQG
ncbi:RNA ligase family protein [Spirillospora sp. NBC_01491]|uniref:RNA ligase family protein n=1 Tax=Spirillospora sp. NBC_01491 TaxID=2976007 RepID=UPI002E32375D|nr:RNA ligase family protein [Spirillospora sp. NBC_01491]